MHLAVRTVTVAVILLLAAEARAVNPAARCAAAKLKATGKLAAARLGCQATAIRKNLVSAQPCDQPAVANWTAAFDKAEERGGCATPDDAGTIGAKVDAFHGDVLDELVPTGFADAERACIAAKVKAAGRKARAKLACQARAARMGDPVNVVCLARAERMFADAFADAEGDGPCATTGDAPDLETKVDAFVDDVVAEEPTVPTATTTTTTLGPLTQCCAAERLELVSGSGGTLLLATLPIFPLPADIRITIDTAAADGPPTCRHPAIVPAGGFTTPAFCLPATGFSARITANGCESGGADGSGALWDDGASCPDADVSKEADTSEGVCNPLDQPCDTNPGEAGANTLGNIDTTRGDATCDAPGLHTRLDIPARVTLWAPFDYEGCPDADGQYDPGTDTLVTQFDTILGLTTATARAAFVDQDHDGCARAGSGPDTAGPLAGTPATGQCCAVGQTPRLVAAGAEFSGGAPLYDLAYATSIPTSVTTCGTPVGGSCTLTTDPCRD